MKKLFVLAALAAAAAGCASTPPPRELQNARTAYQRTSQMPGAGLAVDDVRDAQLALNRAEQSYADDAKSQKTRDLAYIAERKAISAGAKADAMSALQDKRTAEADLQSYRRQNAVATRAQLEQTKQQLAAAQQQAESQRRARIAADEAFQKIQGLQAKQSDRGLVLTLSGSVLFASGKSVLIPQSQQRLQEVAKALEQDKRKIVVVGHTDSVGKDETNQKLSEARAAAVKNYLVAHGVPQERITSEGMGKSQPIADNGTPEGRANNRRVEIILENGGQGAGGTPSPSQNTPPTP